MAWKHTEEQKRKIGENSRKMWQNLEIRNRLCEKYKYKYNQEDIILDYDITRTNQLQIPQEEEKEK